MKTPKSSNIASHKYDFPSRTLTVIFQNGRKYSYADVPSSKYREFTQAASVGGFLNSRIKPHHKATEIKI